MRLKPEIADFIKTGLQNQVAESEVYVFGSRVVEDAKGGDIDILWLTPVKVPQKQIRKFRVAFYRKYGMRKLDIVNFTYQAQDIFKEIALAEAVRL